MMEWGHNEPNDDHLLSREARRRIGWTAAWLVFLLGVLAAIMELRPA
jgi:hypothetical protein